MRSRLPSPTKRADSSTTGSLNRAVNVKPFRRHQRTAIIMVEAFRRFLGHACQVGLNDQSRPCSHGVEGMAMDRPTSGRSIGRFVAVLAITLFALFNSASDVTLTWHAFSGFGFSMDIAQTIIGVEPGGPADRAGLKIGDVFDGKAMPFASRRFLQTGIPAVPDGSQGRFAVKRPGGDRFITLASVPRTRTLADTATNLALMVAITLSIGIGAWLVLLRPSVMTWSFFLFSAFQSGPNSTVSGIVGLSWFLVDYLAWSTLYGLALVPLIVFALRFPDNRADGWRRVAERTAVASTVILLPLNAYVSYGPMFGWPTAFVGAVLGIIGIAALPLVVCTFVLSYVHAPDTDRAKIRWVGVGLVIGYVGPLSFAFLTSIPNTFAWPVPLFNIVQTLQVAVPLSVAYVIVRHRVFDVRFVLGRAAVYGALTSLVVIAVSLVDFIAGKVISETRLAAVGDAAIAIVIGLSLNGLHKRAELTVERLFFRGRRKAEERLHRVGEGLLRARSREGITNAIVAESVAALQLTSCAVFVREGDRFTRTVAIGWEELPKIALASEDPAVLALASGPKPLAVRDRMWPPSFLPAGLLAPVSTLSVFVRGELDAIVFFGSHTGGELLDPEELVLLARLLHDSGIAFEHVESQAAIAQSAELRAEVATLRSLLLERVR